MSQAGFYLFLGLELLYLLLVVSRIVADEIDYRIPVDPSLYAGISTHYEASQLEARQ